MQGEAIRPRGRWQEGTLSWSIHAFCLKKKHNTAAQCFCRTKLPGKPLPTQGGVSLATGAASPF